MLESLVNFQLKEFLSTNNILSEFQSGFRKKHSTTTAALKVVNYFIYFLDNREHCAALFIDLSKAFDTVDHALLLQRLVSIGLSGKTVCWFENYLSCRSQCVRAEGLTCLQVSKGVPQGSVLGPLLFIIYINSLNNNVLNANLHFYADDTVIYCSASTPKQALCQVQNAFNIVQSNMCDLKLVLNAAKTKLMMFSKAKPKVLNLPPIPTLQGTEIESVLQYKYLGILIDNSLSFKPHIVELLKKLRIKLGFFFRNKSCFSYEAKKRLVSATFLSVLGYGDVVYMNASSQCLHSLDTVYHGALRFITDLKTLTHHCNLYTRVGWSSLTTRRLKHWHILIYKAILGALPLYLRMYINRKCTGSYRLRSENFFLLTVPKVRTDLGKRAFSYAAPQAWNLLQTELKLRELVSLNALKATLTDLEAGRCVCKCFG